jgi:FKBP-type peptidyl-prolyl cis-trans isomerase (trigger factor)
MKTQIEKMPKSTMKLTVTVENNIVKEFYEKEVKKAVEETEIQGFRKGTAPRDMVIGKVGNSKLYGDTINEILQTYYPQALKENKVMPVSNPKVEIKEFDIEKDLEFTAEFAVKPEVKMGDYKKALKDYYKEKTEKKKIENLEKLKKGELDIEKEGHEHVHIGANEVIDVLLKESEVEIADMLIEEETDRLMSKLLEQLETIKLPLDKYLKAQEKTADDIRADYTKLADNNIKAEFVLSHLVEAEKIEVSDEEIDEMINAAGDPAVAEQMQDPMQKLYIKTILQKNKLLNNLIEETQGPHNHDHDHEEESDEEEIGEESREEDKNE